MTALTEFDRLEATGLWRADPEAQRVEVIISIGEATLTISDAAERALSHWSLPALHRLNPGKTPALYAPSKDAEQDETLEISDPSFIEALEKLRKIINKRRPKSGRLRLLLTAGLIALVVLGGLFWLPGALVNQTLSVLPDASRNAVGRDLLSRIRRVSGAQCSDPLGRAALDRLANRVIGAHQGEVIVMSSGLKDAVHLPGGYILLARAMVEDYNEPDVAAGHMLVEALRAELYDPMRALLDYGGLGVTFKLLTTGQVSDAVLDGYAEQLLLAQPEEIDTATLLAAFGAAELRTTPYAYAKDMTGESQLALIEGDPVPMSAATPLIPDSDWVGLQGICGE